LVGKGYRGVFESGGFIWCGFDDACEINIFVCGSMISAGLLGSARFVGGALCYVSD